MIGSRHINTRTAYMTHFIGAIRAARGEPLGPASVVEISRTMWPTFILLYKALRRSGIGAPDARFMLTHVAMFAADGYTCGETGRRSTIVHDLDRLVVAA